MKEWLIKLLGGISKKSFGGIYTLNSYPVYGDNNAHSNTERYLTLDDVYSVVKFRARTTAAIPLRVYKIKNQAKLKEYQYKTQHLSHTTKGLVQRLHLKSQAMEEVDDNNELRMLLDNPNKTYGKFEFYEGVYTSPLLTGNAFVNMMAPEMGVNAGKPKELHLMPPQYTYPVVSGDFPKSITGYQMNMNGIQEFKAESVLHYRYFNPKFTTNGGELMGVSPLSALHRTAERGKAENDFMVSGFQNKGAQGIVNFEDFDSSDTDTEAALIRKKTEFYTEASGTRNAQKTIFHPGKTSYTQIGMGPVEMKVIESQKITFKKFCNALFVSDVLFNNNEASTESNVQEMVKRMYTNACLPDARAFADLLNNRLVPYFNKGGVAYYIDVDITGIPELQEDMKKMADVFSALPIMNPAWISEALGYGVEDTTLDKIYVKNGYTLLEDLGVNDLPLTPDYANQ